MPLAITIRTVRRSNAAAGECVGVSMPAWEVSEVSEVFEVSEVTEVWEVSEVWEVWEVTEVSAHRRSGLQHC
jgi:hypothetical protein